MGWTYNGGDRIHGRREDGCRGCKADIMHLSHRRRWCDDCSGKREHRTPARAGLCWTCDTRLDEQAWNKQYCQPCLEAREKQADLLRYHSLSPEEKKARQHRRRLRRFGLTQDQYDALLDEQQNRCAICLGKEPRGNGTWHIDHCHTTGRVRGLLCGQCNVGIGNLRDDADILLRAHLYLQRAGRG